MLEKLGEDHVSWLLVAADNFLRQQRLDRAAVLLDFVGLLDPHNIQRRKLLAYTHWLQGDRRRCAMVVESLLRQQLSDEDRAALELMNLGLGGAVPAARAAKRTPRRV